MADLKERWRAEMPGEADHCFLADPDTASVYISDGWSVAYAALRLHRLDLFTGRELAETRTRHQPIGALATDRGSLYAAGDSRLFELEPTTLSIKRQWDRGLVRFTKQIVPAGSVLVAANWLRPSIGIFHPDTGHTRRVQVGSQPLLVLHEGRVKVVSGFDGGLAILNTERARLEDRRPTIPIATASAGAEIWGVAAGPPQGGQGRPPVWTRRGSNALVRLTGPPLQASLPADCDAVDCDDARRVVWCRLARPERDLVAVAQDSGQVIARYAPPPGFVFEHVSPAAGFAFAMHATRDVRGGVLVAAKATCACLALP